MPTLTKKSMDAYRRNLKAVEKNALNGFSDASAAVAQKFMDAPDEDARAVYRAYLIDDVYRRIDTAQAQAQAFADDMFEALVKLNTAPHEPFPYEAADARVRSAAVHLFRDRNVREFVRVLESFIRQEVRGAASRATAENVETQIN